MSYTDGVLNYTYSGTTATVIGPVIISPTGSLSIPTSIDVSGTTYTITHIGDYAFDACSGLTSLTFQSPSSVKSIGIEAFQDCSGFMGSLTIPSTVTSIGSAAFSGCSGLTGTLILPPAIPLFLPLQLGAYSFFNTNYTSVITNGANYYRGAFDQGI